mmetsp:Transcript_23587/g.75705  ORF Transcript_23587/g.75705 Transcript_23587/m.75705 type:complete len:428 (-) Transcript_23587:1282-2565(-)
MRRSVVQKLLGAWLVLVAVASLVFSWVVRRAVFRAEGIFARKFADEAAKCEAFLTTAALLTATTTACERRLTSRYHNGRRRYVEGYRWGWCPDCVMNSTEAKYVDVDCACSAKRGDFQATKRAATLCAWFGIPATVMAAFALFVAVLRRRWPRNFKRCGVRCFPRLAAETKEKAADFIVAVLLGVASLVCSGVLLAIIEVLSGRNTFRNPMIVCERRWRQRLCYSRSCVVGDPQDDDGDWQADDLWFDDDEGKDLVVIDGTKWSASFAARRCETRQSAECWPRTFRRRVDSFKLVAVPALLLSGGGVALALFHANLNKACLDKRRKEPSCCFDRKTLLDALRRLGRALRNCFDYIFDDDDDDNDEQEGFIASLNGGVVVQGGVQGGVQLTVVTADSPDDKEDPSPPPPGDATPEEPQEEDDDSSHSS